MNTSYVFFAELTYVDMPYNKEVVQMDSRAHRQTRKKYSSIFLLYIKLQVLKFKGLILGT